LHAVTTNTFVTLKLKELNAKSPKSVKTMLVAHHVKFAKKKTNYMHHHKLWMRSFWFTELEDGKTEQKTTKTNTPVTFYMIRNSVTSGGCRNFCHCRI